MVAAHVPGHATACTARLKDNAFVVSYRRDLFYLFALEVYGALHSLTVSYGRVRFIVSSGNLTHRCLPSQLSFGTGCRSHFKGRS